MRYASPPNVYIVVWALWHGAFPGHCLLVGYFLIRLLCLGASFNQLHWKDLKGRNNALSADIYIYDRPEERATNKVGSRNKFVDGRIHELVEKPPIYYRSLRVEHFHNTRVQQTTTIYI